MIDTRPRGVTCSHLALLPMTDGWGHCPDCGALESAAMVRLDSGVPDEGEIEQRIDEAAELAANDAYRDGEKEGYGDGMNDAFNAAADAVEPLARELAGLLDEDESDDSLNIPAHWLTVIEKVCGALEDRGWQS